MPKDIFHITSAGSVDDGKSTILARLLLDTGSVFEDQLGGVDVNNVTATTIADLLDGLESERDQGITIDVAHRFFDSPDRRYHIADSPGHEQYTRNMATAASHADALLLVVDARVGVKPQTITHYKIAQKLGIGQVVVAINKMDLVGNKKAVFEQRLSELRAELPHFSPEASMVVPVSGLTGANIVRPSKTMSWWHGPTILESLDSLTHQTSKQTGTAFAVQYVQRLAGGGRRYLGTLMCGSLSEGDTLYASGGTKPVVVSEISSSGLPAQTVSAPAEIGLSVKQEVDIRRGEVLVDKFDLHLSDHVEADVVWLSSSAGVSGRTYEVRLGHAETRGSITRLWRVDDDSDQKAGEVHALEPNSITRATISLTEKVSLTPFRDFPELGRFILIDPGSGNTVGAGVVNHSLRRVENVIPHDFSVNKADRETLTGHQGKVLWFTGLSGSGKSTIVDRLSQELLALGIAHGVLDGDSLRQGLNKDLGFGEADRVENIRRTAEVSKLMADSGLIVLVSLISPYREDRTAAADIVGVERFAEIFVDTPLDVCESRDPKGLYRKARAGEIPHFTGVSAPYEEPQSPTLRIDGRRDWSSIREDVIRLVG